MTQKRTDRMQVTKLRTIVVEKLPEEGGRGKERGKLVQ